MNKLCGFGAEGAGREGGEFLSVYTMFTSEQTPLGKPPLYRVGRGWAEEGCTDRSRKGMRTGEGAEMEGGVGVWGVG